MKFVRPLMEVEATPLRDEEGKTYAYLCDFGDGKETPVLTPEELAKRGFRMLNGHEPGKPLKRRKKVNYRSAEEAPVLAPVGNGAGGIDPAQEYDHQ